ncbi:MAG TPA: HAMP domain-containing sensor histidine kinase [Sphingobacteriaceae bacterium]
MGLALQHHRKNTLKIGVIILLASAIIILLNFYSFRILTSIRAFVNGESQYAKGQLYATLALNDYIDSGREADFRKFRQEIAVPVGDSIARVLILGNRSFQEVAPVLLQARNHREDLKNMIWLFKRFHNFSYMKDAIEEWRAGDRYIIRLRGEADEFRRLLQEGKADPAERNRFRETVNDLSGRMRKHQEAFSNILGEASRELTTWLFIANVTLVCLILVSTGWYASLVFKQLIDSRERVQKQSKITEEFLSIASHELKTPLTTLRASLQVLERQSRNSEATHTLHPFVCNSIKQVERLSGLVTDLLDLTNIQAGKLVLKPIVFKLNELIENVTEESRMLYMQELDLEPLPVAWVHADYNRVRQVLDNLISNAAKYSPTDSNILINMTLQGNKVQVNVRDFGPGIPESKAPYIFDRFYRVKGAENVAQGLGLGLFICREIVSNHNGKIGIHDNEGQGSTF